jgi:hypothetical protein
MGLVRAMLNLAVVRVDASALPPLVLGDLTTVHPGDQGAEEGRRRPMSST